jgi:hypothetical protein
MDPQEEQEQEQQKPKLTPKEELMSIMFEAFELIEQLEIPEGQYLQFADMFKRMNGVTKTINVERFVEIRTIIINNQYYQDRERRETIAERARRNKVEDAEKVNHPEYGLCSCGKYIKFYTTSGNKTFIKNHYKTNGHFRGYRLRKLGGKNVSDDKLKELIGREVLIQCWVSLHILKVREIQNEYEQQLINERRRMMEEDFDVGEDEEEFEEEFEFEFEEDEEEIHFQRK